MIATMPTLKYFPRTVRFSRNGMNVQALGARLTGIRGINRNQFNTVLQAFVAEKHPELEECPTIATSALYFAAKLLIRSLSDARQIFNSNDGIVLKCRQNNQFTDVMVQPCLIAPLSARQPLQNLPCP